jgi:Fe-S oxidoreductase
MFPEDPDVKAVQDATFDPFEYFVARHRDGRLRTDFREPLGKVSYHIPCHLRVQNVGQKTRETLQLVPGTELNTIERCSGHAGTWGVKEQYFDLALKIGRPVFRQMSATDPDWISSDCSLAAMHIEQGIARNAAAAGAVAIAAATQSPTTGAPPPDGTPAPPSSTPPPAPAKAPKKAHPLTLLRIAYGL